MSEQGKQSNFKIAVGELMGGMAGIGTKPREDEPLPQSHFSGGSNEFGPSIQPLRRVESVIADDMVIEGTVTSRSDIRIHGRIKGDVSTSSSILASGIVDGNMEGENITLAGSTINGDVSAMDALLLDGEAVVVGNLAADTLELDGRVKGNLTIDQNILLKRDSIVFGDISAKSISIEEGASIKGMMNVVTGDFNERTFLSRSRREEPPYEDRQPDLEVVDRQADFRSDGQSASTPDDFDQN